MMRKLFIFTVIVCLSLASFAQTQHGYVKTKGRAGNNNAVIAGTGIPGATVQVRGRSAVLSQSNGTFSFPVPSQSFYLQSVQKQGYVLIDPDVLSRQYVYSKNPLVIVLETKEQLADDKLTSERKIRRTLERQLQEREDEIESLKKQNKLSEEEYRKRLQEIYAQQESNEKLISEMADYYSKMDFDEIDEFNRRIRQLILDGKLTEADSLINSKGDLVSRANTLRQQQQAITKAEEELQKQQKAQEKRKTLTQKALEDFGQDCYSKFEIFKLKYQNDSAAFCLELRASVDPKNIRWQKEAGDFLLGYVADYQKALSYYEMALKEALLHGDGISYEVMSLNASIGVVHAILGDHTKKNEFFEEAKNVADEIHSQLYFQTIEEVETELNVKIDDLNLPQETLEKANQRYFEKSYVYLADSYKHIAALYSRMGGYASLVESFDYYEEALDNYEDLLEVQEKNLGDANLDVAETCINIGVMHSKSIEFDEALEYYERAQMIVENLYGENHLLMVTIYNNIGQVYAEKGNYLKALDYFEKTMSILENESEVNHRSIVNVYNNAGAMCISLERYSDAMDYYSKALKINEKVLGEKHPQVGKLYERIGYVYSEQGDYQKAIEYCYKGLMISERVYGKSNPVMESSYKVMSDIYIKQGDYDKALDYYQKILEINEKQNDETNIFRAICYNGMGDIYYAKGDYDDALDCFQKVLMVVEKIYNEEESIMTQSNDEGGSSYYYVKSKEYMVLISMQKKLEMTPNIATCYNNIGKVYCQKGDFDKALDYYQKALAIQQSVLGDNHPDVMETKKAIDEVKLKVKKK